MDPTCPTFSILFAASDFPSVKPQNLKSLVLHVISVSLDDLDIVHSVRESLSQFVVVQHRDLVGTADSSQDQQERCQTYHGMSGGSAPILLGKCGHYMS